MKLKDMFPVLANSNINYDIFDNECSWVVTNFTSLNRLIEIGFDTYMNYEVDYMSVVDTEVQPETLQIYLK